MPHKRIVGISLVILAVLSLFLANKLDFNSPRVGDNDFSRGFFRQLWGPDHVLLCILTGVYACRQIPRLAYLTLAMFFLSSVVSYALVSYTNQLLFFISLAVGLLLIAILLLGKAEKKLKYVVSIAGPAGFYNGLQHALEMPVYLKPVIYGLGVSFSSVLLVLGGAAFGYLTRPRKPGISQHA